MWGSPLLQSTVTTVVIVYIRYCEQRSCVLGPQQPKTLSWAWWRPGWGWWRSDGWSAYGRTHESYSRMRKTKRSQKETQSITASPVTWNVFNFLYVFGICCSDLRVSTAEEEESAAHWDGWSILLHGEIRQPLRAGSWWDIWKLFIIVVIIMTHYETELWFFCFSHNNNIQYYVTIQHIKFVSSCFLYWITFNLLFDSYFWWILMCYCFYWCQQSTLLSFFNYHLSSPL